MRRSLSESVIVITGASSGIGRATALAFADTGARVVLAARRETALREAAADCEARGAQALAVPTDVRDEAAVRRLAATAEERFGGIDIWVNNAGVTLLGRFEDAPADLWREVLETNFFGAVRARSCGPNASPPRSSAAPAGLAVRSWSACLAAS